MKEPFFEELSYQMPASLGDYDLKRLGAEGCNIMAALGMLSGIAHLEIIDSPLGVKALDVGLRIGGGGLTHQLMQIAKGTNLVEACLLEALGHDPTLALFQLNCQGNKAEGITVALLSQCESKLKIAYEDKQKKVIPSKQL